MKQARCERIMVSCLYSKWGGRKQSVPGRHRAVWAEILGQEEVQYIEGAERRQYELEQGLARDGFCPRMAEWVIAKDTIWIEKPKIFTLWTFGEKVCWLLNIENGKAGAREMADKNNLNHSRPWRLQLNYFDFRLWYMENPWSVLNREYHDQVTSFLKGTLAPM